MVLGKEIAKETPWEISDAYAGVFARLVGTPSSPVVFHPLCENMITTEVSTPISIEGQRENELQEARAIQRAMLASEALKAPQLSIESEFQPFSEVGGDFLDYFLLSDGTAGLYLGDVTGKGLRAALFAALAVGTLRGIHKTGTPPSAVLALMNKRMMLKSVSLRYAAMQYAHLDPETGVMQISSAGMHGPLHLRADGCDELVLCGIPPGLFPHADYEMNQFSLLRVIPWFF